MDRSSCVFARVAVFAAILMSACAVPIAPPQTYGGEKGWRGAKLRAGYSPGKLRHTIKQTNLDDEVDANLVHLRIEGGAPFGGGATVEWYQTEDDLYQTIPNNTLGASELLAVEIAPHIHYKMGEHSRFRGQLRLGFPIRYFQQEYASALFDSEWVSSGVRLSLEPELMILTEPGLRWSLYAEGGASIGYTYVVVETTGPGVDDTEEFGATTTGYTLEGGTRFELGNFYFGASYILRHSEVDDGEIILGVPFGNFESEFEGLMFTGGLHF